MYATEGPRKRERRPPHRIVARLIVAFLATGAFIVQASVAVAEDTPNVGVLPFAGDVFTVGSNGSLIAVDPSATPLSAPLFNLAGEPLNLTWGQFSSASATSLARAQGNHTALKITLSGLTPNGVYSLYYRTFTPDSANPICGASGDHDPLVALTARHPDRQQPDADSFVADSSGAAQFDARVAGRLLDAQQLQLVVIYHFDGQTYGPVPTRSEATNNCLSSFGVDAMRQLLIVQK